MSKNQVKKLGEDIYSSEWRCIEKIITYNADEAISISRHLANKMEVTFDPDRLSELLVRRDLENLVVEINANFKDDEIMPNDVRLLIRDDERVYTQMKDKHTGVIETVPCNMCFVYSLTKNQIITMYWNKAYDNHLTLDDNRYSQRDFYPYLQSLVEYKEFKHKLFMKGIESRRRIHPRRTG